MKNPSARGAENRRNFLTTTALFGLAIHGLRQHAIAADAGRTKIGAGYGPLKSDPDRILDLPSGFNYRVISKSGERMTDGFIVPGAPDGMAAFPAPNGRTLIIRNHEISPGAKPASGAFGNTNELAGKLTTEQVYDPGHRGNLCLGGTTSLLYDPNSGRVESSWLSIAGTLRNCAGGPTPWNSWVTCEETVITTGKECRHDHGFNFEVPATFEPGLAAPIPLREMGRFNHEAIAVDPRTGIVYQTEDRPDGLIYRFIPKQAGKLADGGRLQALAIADRSSFDTRNWSRPAIRPGESRSVRWVDLKDVADSTDLLRYRGSTDGAATFARGEGMWCSDGVIFFACTNGGRSKRGQIWKYVPGQNEGQPNDLETPGRLELFIEPDNPALVDMADNITVAPWGDLIVCEDGEGEQNLVGIEPDGGIYRFAHNALNNSEFAGACFSPDASTLFVNIQKAGLTLAITGPWKKA
jgi:secreted PhoX family phosphatase